MTFADRVLLAIREHELVSAGERVVVGVSGGPDSLALLHVLKSLAPRLGIQLHVAHLDHQLRGSESEADAAFVAETARAWDLPATVDSRSVADYARARTLSIEEAGRIVRYRFLAETAQKVGARTIAVAHNADDQSETVLMHLLRGSGLAGLRGMAYKSPLPTQNGQLPITNPAPPGNHPLTLIRPLLGITRTEILSYCEEQDLQPRYDRSNDETRYWRNRLRHEVFPYLERFNPQLREVLRHTAESIADDYAYLQEQLNAAFDAVAHAGGNALVFDLAAWKALPTSLQRATLREAVRRLNRELRNINWVHINEARRIALSGQVGARATLPQFLSLVVGYDSFSIGESVPRPDWPFLFEEPIILRVGETTRLPGTKWAVKVATEDERRKTQDGLRITDYELRITKDAPGHSPFARWSATFDADRVLGALLLSRRRPGDRFQPNGLQGHEKTLHDFMINEKIPSNVRDLLPLLCDAEKILWVCGFRPDERARVTDATTRLLRVEFIKIG